MFQALKDSKRFNIDLMSLDLPDLDRYTYRFDDGKTERYYRLDDNHYFASVTTMMGEWPSKKKFLADWRKRVGDKEADRKMNKGGNRGTRMHEICERYLMNDPNPYKGEFPDSIELFRMVQPVLNERIDNIRAVEARLFSKKLLLAGTVDLIADFDGELSIIDFKSAHNNPSEGVLESHAIQMCAYSVMWEELTGIDIERMVNIYAVNSGQYSTADRFSFGSKCNVISKTEWLPKLYQARYEYEKAKSLRNIVSKELE